MHSTLPVEKDPPSSSCRVTTMGQYRGDNGSQQYAPVALEIIEPEEARPISMAAIEIVQYNDMDKETDYLGRRNRQGHSFCGGCCDMHRAVILVNIVSLVLSLFYLLFLMATTRMMAWARSFDPATLWMENSTMYGNSSLSTNDDFDVEGFLASLTQALTNSTNDDDILKESFESGGGDSPFATPTDDLFLQQAPTDDLFLAMMNFTDDDVQRTFDDLNHSMERSMFSAMISILCNVICIFGVYAFNGCLVAVAAIAFAVKLVIVVPTTFSCIVAGLFLYPHLCFLWQVRRGILSRINYKNEQHACCNKNHSCCSV